jgi:hypothetical protein
MPLRRQQQARNEDLVQTDHLNNTKVSSTVLHVESLTPAIKESTMVALTYLSLLSLSVHKLNQSPTNAISV